jgi:hypothetical protein
MWVPKPDGLLGLLAKESKTREIKPRIHCITQQTQTHTYIQPSTTTVVSFHGEAHVYVHTQLTYIHTHTHTSPIINAQVIVYNTTNTNTHIYTAKYYYCCFFSWGGPCLRPHTTHIHTHTHTQAQALMLKSLYITQQTQTHTYIQPSTTTVVSFHGEAHSLPWVWMRVCSKNKTFKLNPKPKHVLNSSPSINAQVIV